MGWTPHLAGRTYSLYSLGMGLANERWHYIVMPSLIGSAHTQSDPWFWPSKVVSKIEENLGTLHCVWFIPNICILQTVVVLDLIQSTSGVNYLSWIPGWSKFVAMFFFCLSLGRYLYLHSVTRFLLLESSFCELSNIYSLIERRNYNQGLLFLWWSWIPIRKMQVTCHHSCETWSDCHVSFCFFFFYQLFTMSF